MAVLGERGQAGRLVRRAAGIEKRQRVVELRRQRRLAKGQLVRGSDLRLGVAGVALGQALGQGRRPVARPLAVEQQQ